ncbi:putative pit accessory protein [Sphingomonas haloaromaticamans]|uniref:Putative pit accessory protein n=2 Tax=Edaphosphingomonas haloaromaticamans TaxID=653954 RepID=A0A1S1HL97_9SPHN|nr:putative pit accessory protein [Sphingomonas haloaromaticamans]
MLITSRDTGRWVIPKGNPIRGLDPHRAAAHEAYEEAGVSGIPCPSALGTYRYRKRKNNGESRNATVAVFPLAVLKQAEEWPEQDERETRWFTLAEAADAVAEPQLKQLIAGFRAPVAPAGLLERGLACVRNWGATIPMLRWFQALMPKQGRFFEQFEDHAATLVAGADALARLLEGGDDMADHVREIFEREHEADEIIREVLQDVRRILITPFDRSAITSLIGVMDDAIDQMNKTAKAITLYEIIRFEPQMRDMAGIIVEAARITAEAMPLLRSVGTNGGRLHELTERLVRIEGHADEIHDAGLRALYRAHIDSKPLEFIVGREIYSHLEKIVDRFEDVANEIQGLVIDHA